MASTETPPLEPAHTATAAVEKPPADSSAASTDGATAPEGTTTAGNSLPIPLPVSLPAESSIPPATEPVATAAASPTTESTSAPAAETQPRAVGPEHVAPKPLVSGGTASGDGRTPEAAAAVDDTPASVVAQPVEPATPPAVAAVPTAPTTPKPAPAERPRPLHSRYLVVPESIAVQADASFAATASAPQQAAATPTSAGMQTASRSASNSVRPLPPTTTADRSGQVRPQTGPQGRPPQRQGRQSQPTNPGAPTTTPPQPRLGAAMFPNLSAGIDAIEGRMRGSQPAQGQAPAAAPSRPVMAR